MTGSNDEFYQQLKKELEAVAYVPEFYLADADLPSDELGVADRMAPSAWNAKLLYAYAQDPKCPNADYFRDGLVSWVQEKFRFHRQYLDFKQNQLVKKAGIEWRDFYPGLRPIPRLEGERFIDRTMESQIDSLQKELAAANEVLALFAQAADAKTQTAYREILKTLEGAKA